MTAEPSDERQRDVASGRRRRRRRRRKPRTEGTTAGSEGRGAGTPAAPEGNAKGKGGGRQAGDGQHASKAASAKGGTPRARSTGSKGRKKRGSTSQKRAAKQKGSAKRSGGATKPGRRQPWTREVSAGGVVYRLGDGDHIEVVLASRRTRRGDLAWGLAKGGIEDGESKEEAAIREVREETGLVATIEADLGLTRYMYVWEDVRIRKTVHFFLMRHIGGDVDDRDDEMEEIRWFPLERALKRAAYKGERDVLARAAEHLR